MTLPDLKAHVWKKLGIRKHLVGRREVDLLTQLSVENWQGDFLNAADSPEERAIVAQGMLSAVRRVHQAVGSYGDREYGFIWTFLLSSLASAVIQILIKWWLERRTNRALMLVWQYEAQK